MPTGSASPVVTGSLSCIECQPQEKLGSTPQTPPPLGSGLCGVLWGTTVQLEPWAPCALWSLQQPGVSPHRPRSQAPPWLPFWNKPFCSASSLLLASRLSLSNLPSQPPKAPFHVQIRDLRSSLWVRCPSCSSTRPRSGSSLDCKADLVYETNKEQSRGCGCSRSQPTPSSLVMHATSYCSYLRDLHMNRQLYR